MLFLVAGAAACALLLWLLKGLASAVRTHLMMLKIPTPPAASLLLGHIGVLDSDQAPYIVHSMTKKLGPIFRLRMAHTHLVVVSDLAEAQRICTRGEHYLDKAREIYKAFDIVHNDFNLHSIISMPTNDQWRAIRRATAPCFTSASIKAALPLLIDVTHTIAEQLEAAGPTHAFDMNDISKRFTLDAIAMWAFDQPVHASDNLRKDHELVRIVNDMIHTVHMVAVDPLWQLKKGSPKVQAGMRSLHIYDSWMAEYSQRLKARSASLPANSIGAALLGLDDPTVGGKMSDNSDLLKSNVAIFVAAGYETTANTITMAALFLLRFPKWMDRVEAELDAAGLLKTPARRDPRALVLSDLSQLPVLNAVIKETLRMMPAGAMGSFRKTTVDTQIAGHTVPAGVIVNFPPYVINNSTHIYGKDAEEFNPGRWLGPETIKQLQGLGKGGDDDTAPQDDRLKEPLTFSTGPRDCIGQALAWMELQVFLSMLLSRFKIQLAPSMGTPEEAWAAIVYHVTFTTASGLWMTAEPR